jgi:pyruvate/2-oxoglutarate dehydrogenase complex dihydrolipoamide acyltransferase (E2) component
MHSAELLCIVPVLKGVNDMLLAEVTRTAHDLVGRAREGGLLPDSWSGSNTW